MKKVFVSYVRENTDVIDRICNYFDRNGIEYWLDRNNIEPGKDWKAAIRQAIVAGGLFLACFSAESVSKEKTHMNEELLLAIEIFRQKQSDSGWFIPLRISNCRLPTYEIAPGKVLSDLQALDMHEDFHKGLERLGDVVLNRLGTATSKKRAVDNMADRTAMEELGLQYRSCKALIDSCDGTYFHNADMGHPVYLAGATGAMGDSWSYADGPERNILFKALARISTEIKVKNPDVAVDYWIPFDDLSTWQGFCLYVVNTYRRTHGYKEL